MAVRRVRVGDVLTLHRVPVQIDEAESYKQIGIYSWGKGFIHRPACLGFELSKLRYFQIPVGALVLSNIQAWEAALAVSTEAEVGFIGSNRFLSYLPRTSDVDVRYLLHYFLSEPGLHQIRQASPGTQVRNRTLGQQLFERLEIPLPDVAVQRRIAVRLDRIAKSALDLLDREMTTYTSALTAIDFTVELLQTNAGPQAPLGEVADVNPRRARVETESVAFVPMAAVDEVTGTIASPQMRSAQDTRTGYTQFRRGDVIFARITPCMQNGKSAVFDDADVEFGYGSTEFHVVRPRPDGPTADWLHTVFRSQWFKNAAREKFSGTAGQQRVSAAAFKELPIPVPSKQGATEVLEHLGRLETLRQRLRSLAVQRRTIAAALLPAARNEAFAKLT